MTIETKSEPQSIDPINTEEQVLKDLVERYAPPSVPPCRVCGALLEISACGGGKPTMYMCSNEGPGKGKPVDWGHLENSRWEDRRAGGDPRVIDLVSSKQKLNQETMDLREEFKSVLPLLEAAAAGKPVSIAAGDWVRRVNALLGAHARGSVPVK